jgi:hypothetical protein
VDTIALADHLRVDGSTHKPGIYRVVGVDERRVTLLRVGDDDGTRVSTGEVVRVEREALSAFAPAEPPSAGRTATAPISFAYWSLRAFLAELAARPWAGAIALALVVAGSVGPVSSPLASGLVFAGIFLLAYVGSGRLRG